MRTATIQLAVGARGRNVRRQFLLESVVLSLFGGIIGVACGLGFSRLIAQLQDWPVLISLFCISGGFSVSACNCFVFWIFPPIKPTS